MKKILLLLILVFFDLLYSPVHAACTDGVDCLCDKLAGDPSIAWCEDFDDLSWDDGTGQAFGADPKYTNLAGYVCPAGPGYNGADEGTDNE